MAKPRLSPVTLPDVPDERVTYARIAGAVIRRLREGTPQAAVAASSGLSQSALSRFENGQSLPDMYETMRLARALGRTPSDLLRLVDHEVVMLVGRSREVAKVAAGLVRRRPRAS